MRSCGTISLGGFCYTFNPNSLRITNPVGDFLVFDEIVDQNSQRTCCECQPSCPKTDLSQHTNPCWQNAQHNQFTGQFEITPSTVAGKCCCRPGDIYRLDYLKSTAELGWNGTDFSNYQELGLGTSGLFPPVPGVPQLTVGIRRDFLGQCQYPIHERLSRDGPFNDGAWQLTEKQNIPCQWHDLLFSANGFTDFSMAVPSSCPSYTALGGVMRGPCPYEVDANGKYDDQGPANWYYQIEYYNIVANCQQFQYRAQYTRRLPDGTIIDRVTNEMRWSVTEDPSVTGICTGGCPTTDPPLTNPGNGTGPEIIPPNQSSTGCSGCGQGGGF